MNDGVETASTYALPEIRDAYILLASGRYFLSTGVETFSLPEIEAVETLLKIVALRVRATPVRPGKTRQHEASVEAVVHHGNQPAAIVRVDGDRRFLLPFQPPHRPSVHWLAGRFEDGWISTEAVLVASGWREFRLKFYVPMAGDGQPKRLSIVVDGAEIVERFIARDTLEEVLIATRSPEQEIFVQLLADEAEPVANEDERQLGFVAIVPETDAGAGEPVAIDATAELFQQRLQANLRISARALHALEGDLSPGGRKPKLRLAIVADEVTLPRARNLQGLAGRIGSARLVTVLGADDVLPAAAREPSANVVLLASASPYAVAVAAILADRHGAALMLDCGGGRYEPAARAAAAAMVAALPSEERHFKDVWLVRDSPAAAEMVLAPAEASEYGAGVNAARLGLAAADALKARDSLVPAVGTLLREVLDSILPPRPADSPLPADGGIDVVVFWKQADADIYGRRVDRIVEHLLRSGHVRRILRFDAPLHFDEVRRGLLESKNRPVTEEALVAQSALGRWLGRYDRGNLRQRIFLWSHEREARFFGRELPPREAFVDFVADALADWKFDPARTVAWVFPVVWDFPAVAERSGFARILVDIVDDQRTWPLGAHAIASIDQAYRETLACADVVVTNCRPVAEAFESVTAGITVIPNGVDAPSAEVVKTPAALAGRPTPIVGYVGDLRHRIDWPLIARIVEDHPDWTIVLVGPIDANGPARDLKDLPNVVMPGVIPDREVEAWIATFDVAFIPHLINEKTDRMNPLKAYRFAGWGLPVVSTPVGNLDDIASHVRFESEPAAFSQALHDLLGMRRASRSARDALVQILGWPARIDAMLALLRKI